MTNTTPNTKHNFKVTLFYWTEEGELCIDCPQLGVMSIVPLDMEKDLELSILAESQFHKKLRENIEKSGGTKDYFHSQVEFQNGSLTKDAGYLPNSLESFMEKYSYIQRVMEQDGCHRAELKVTI